MAKKNNLLLQIIKFGGVGFLCFLIDFGVLCILTELLSIPVLISAALAFTVSVVVNYILSVVFVFEVSKNHSKKRNFILFIVFSVIGLGLTELLMFLGVDVIHIHYMFVKIISTGIVMIYNFITRKLFLEK